MIVDGAHPLPDIAVEVGANVLYSIPHDLLLYLRTHRLGNRQKAAIRELITECKQNRITAPEYADRYVRRVLKISGNNRIDQ